MKLKRSILALLSVCVLAASTMNAYSLETVIGDISHVVNTDMSGSNVYGVTQKQDGAEVTSTTITVEDGAVVKNVIGGIQVSATDYKNHVNLTDDTLDGGVTINVTGGVVQETIYGGNTLPQPSADMTQEQLKAALGDKLKPGSVTINISGGEIGKAGGDEAIMGGGGRYCGVEGDITVKISGGTINNDVYAGTNGGSVERTFVNISDGTIKGDVYGAGRKSYGEVTGDTSVTISGGEIFGNVYGGGNEDTVKGDTTVTVTGGTFGEKSVIYGGGAKNAKVEGTKNLVLGESGSSADIKVSVADFTSISVKSNATLESLQMADGGTHVEVAQGAALTLNEITITHTDAPLSFSGEGSILRADGTEGFVFTIVLSDDMLLAPQVVDFALIETGFLTGWEMMMQNYYDIQFVTEDGQTFMVDGHQSDTITMLGDADLNAGTGQVVLGVSVLIPEPTTSTLSLLALAGLACRRRRK